jgi:DNA modification methylase
VCQAHQTTYEFFQLGSEVIRDDRRFKKYKGKLDLVFTSPPYYRAEGYSEDEHQSNVKFTTYDKWRDGFLRPTLETAVEWLRPGRPLIWNIADTKEGQRY